ncbi:hypothetical protein IT568_10515 [bacterium]|nr:hypothetical protein [bacterium]
MERYTDFTLEACLKEKRSGKVVKNKVYLPFVADVFSVKILESNYYTQGNETIYDFSTDGQIEIVSKDYFTILYFKEIDSLQEEFGNYKGKVLITCCDPESGNIFDKTTYVTITLSFRTDINTVAIEVNEDLT